MRLWGFDECLGFNSARERSASNSGLKGEPATKGPLVDLSRLPKADQVRKKSLRLLRAHPLRPSGDQEGGERLSSLELPFVALIQRLREICTRPAAKSRFAELDVALLYFHGSRAKGREREDSDYDFAVLLDDRKSWSFLQKVERLDLVAEYLAFHLALPRDSVDIQDMEEMPIGISFDVVGDGLLLFEAEPNLAVCHKRQTYSRYQDFRWTEDFFRKALRKQIRGSH